MTIRTLRGKVAKKRFTVCLFVLEIRSKSSVEAWVDVTNRYGSTCIGQTFGTQGVVAHGEASWKNF